MPVSNKFWLKNLKKCTYPKVVFSSQKCVFLVHFGHKNHRFCIKMTNLPYFLT